MCWLAVGQRGERSLLLATRDNTPTLLNEYRVDDRDSGNRGSNRSGPIGRRLKKSEILRGREIFKRIALKGKRVEGVLLRCKYTMLEDSGALVRVGFKVSSGRKGFLGKLNAVRRNRIRRLMREAFSREFLSPDSFLTSSSSPVGIIVFYKGAKDVVVERISLAPIQSDMQTFCRAIVSPAQVNAQ